ncbi:MAG TPA: leucine-rich repeat protein, partial [Verrucomicrobiae bacterium]
MSFPRRLRRDEGLTQRDDFAKAESPQTERKNMNTHALKILAATKLLPLLLLLALPQSGWAQTQFSVGPFYYQLVGAYNSPGTYAIIYHYDDSEGANVTIPTTVSDFFFTGGYTIPVTTLGGGSYEELFNATAAATVKSVTIGNGITTIGENAFNGCTNLTSVTIPSSVTSIGEDAFANCSSLPKVTIGNGVTNVAQEAFYSCTSLTNVTIGSSVTSFGEDAFESCYSLRAVYFQGNSPTQSTLNGFIIFELNHDDIAYVRPGTTGWQNYFDGLPVIVTNFIGSLVGGVSNIVGNVTVKHPDGATSTLKPGDPILMGDIIQTPLGGGAVIQFNDNTTLAMAERGSVTIDNYVYNPNDNSKNSFLGHLEGAFAWVSGQIGKKENPDVNIETAVGSIGIRGTQFISQQDPCSSTQTVYLIEGELGITPLDTPGVTNICDAPVTIYITPDSVTTNTLNQAMYDSISNQVFQNTGIVTFGSWLEQYFGCTNDPDAAPTADPSGDGQDNYT